MAGALVAREEVLDEEVLHDAVGNGKVGGVALELGGASVALGAGEGVSGYVIVQYYIV